MSLRIESPGSGGGGLTEIVQPLRTQLNVVDVRQAVVLAAGFIYEWITRITPLVDDSDIRGEVSEDGIAFKTGASDYMFQYDGNMSNSSSASAFIEMGTRYGNAVGESFLLVQELYRPRDSGILTCSRNFVSGISFAGNIRGARGAWHYIGSTNGIQLVRTFLRTAAGPQNMDVTDIMYRRPVV